MKEQKPGAYAVWKPGTKGEDIVKWVIEQAREQQQETSQRQTSGPDSKQGSGD
jgi:hypothetical protein